MSKGKDPYDENKISYVKKLTFQYFPCELAEQKPFWAKCVQAIDSSAQALGRQFKKENTIAAACEVDLRRHRTLCVHIFKYV